ncbi:unnamed protein product [Porites evermanni]|uniref:Uncharacterized protein n=1 Tax=Porites evermanni TaxID=104178 RepID=A0ABN8SNK4_9CNID|nr:unnamed protein product [Porites evermanni]
MRSAKKGVSVFNGRSYFPYIWLVFYGVSTGLVKGSACGVTTSLVAIINSKHSKSTQVQGPNKDQVTRDTAHWANKSSTKSPPSFIDIIYHPFHRLWAAKTHQEENQDVEIYESTSVNGNHEASVESLEGECNGVRNPSKPIQEIDTLIVGDSAQSKISNQT